MSSSAGPTGSARRGPQQGNSPDLLPHDLRLLFLGANSKGQSFIEVDLEFLTMETAFLKAGGYKHVCDGSSPFEHRTYTRINDVANRLEEYKPTVVHFSCHGIKQGDGPGELMLSSGKVDGDELVKIILRHNDMARNKDPPVDQVRLVIFNVCNSAKMAQNLAEGVTFDGHYLDGVPFAIGHGDGVFESDALHFSETLLKCMGSEGSLCYSFHQAKSASRKLVYRSNTQTKPIGTQNTPIYTPSGCKACGSQRDVSDAMPLTEVSMRNSRTQINHGRDSRIRATGYLLR